MKRIIGLTSLLGAVGFAASANAGPVSDTLYYTTFNGGQNVWTVTGTYTGNGTAGNGTFTTSGNTNIASTPGADGIVFNPNNGQLLVGGQGTGGSGAIYQVNPGLVNSFTSSNPNMSAYELAVDPNKNVVWSGGSEGGDSRISSTPIIPFGGAGTTVAVSGSVTSITHLTFAPGLASNTAYYTSAADDGSSPHFGTINLLTGVTTDILGGTTGKGTGNTWHGMDYDPFTGDIILAGGDEILQVDSSGTIISSLHLGNGQEFDQGSVDGQGHLYWADNNGRLLFVDYSNTGLIGSAADFTSDQSFVGSFDDIAPLIGAGGDPTGVPEPSPLLLVGAGLLGLSFFRRRLRTA